MYKKTIKKLLQAENYNCGAETRVKITNQVINQYPSAPKLEVNKWLPVLDVAKKIGSADLGTYHYLDARGDVAEAHVYDLYDLPQDLGKNPILVCLSGIMTGPYYVFECMRHHFKKTGKIIPIFFTGLSGNKGLYEDVYNRNEGIIIQSEAEAYMRISELFAPRDYVRMLQQDVTDISTAQNFIEIYNLGKNYESKEISVYLVSGNFSYEKRCLAEGMYLFGDKSLGKVKVNLNIVKCPMKLDFSVPEGHLSEMFLDYVAASLWPLPKDTAKLTTAYREEGKERYNLLSSDEDWTTVKELIVRHNSMGWPNGAEQIYGLAHKETVEEIIGSFIRVRQEISPEIYDQSVFEDAMRYKKFLGDWKEATSFEDFLKNTPEETFF